MDEPLGALDKNLRYQMQVEIKEIQRRLGMTVVYVTHDQEEAMNMSDRIAIMNGGRIEQVGPPLAIYEEPANSFIARFLGEANLIEGELKAISDGIGTFAMAGGQIVQARAKGSPSAAPSLFVRPERISLHGATAARRRLVPIKRPAASGACPSSAISCAIPSTSVAPSSWWTSRIPGASRFADRSRRHALVGRQRQLASRGRRMTARRLPKLLLAPAIAMLGLLFIAPLFWFFINVFAREKSVFDLAERFVEVLTSRPVMFALITTNWICLLVTALALVGRLSDRLLPGEPRPAGVLRWCCSASSCPISRASSCGPIPGWCCSAATASSTRRCSRPD